MKPIFCLLALVLLVAGANAQPATFYVNLTFNDGGTGRGMFTFDPAMNTYSNLYIVTTPGTTRPAGQIYIAACGAATCTLYVPNASEVIALPTATANPTGMPSLLLLFSPALSQYTGVDYGLGGVIYPRDNEGDCLSSTCSTVNATTDRRVTGGTVAPTEPSMFMLLMWG